MRILLVEDDAVLGDALTLSLRQSGYVVDWARNGQEADLALSDQVYDLVLLDIGLPRMDGFEVLKRLRARRSTLPALILTARDSLDDRIKGLDLGADDYLTKPFETPELMARIRALIRRAHAQPQNALSYGALTYDIETRAVTVHGERFNLSSRELALLEVMLMRIGKVTSKEILLEKLCDWSDGMGTNAIEVYMHRLRKKLEPYGIHISTMRGLGYMLEKLKDG